MNQAHTLVSALAGASMEDDIAAIKVYNFGDSTAPLNKVESIVVGSLGNATEMKKVAAALTALLVGDATRDAKIFACRQLALCGGADDIPALAPLLVKIETSDMARIALERIPGEEVNAALIDALGKADIKSQIGIVNTLGVRRAASAVPAIAPLLRSSDPLLAEAAAGALGHIGGADAVRALQGRVVKDARNSAANGLLESAEQFAAAGDAASATKIYKNVGGSSAVKRAAKVALDKGKSA